MKKYIFFIVTAALTYIYSSPTQYSFKNLKNGHWLGEDLLPHPFQDWEIVDESVVSTVNRKRTKLEVLTFDFSERTENATIILNLTIEKIKLLKGVNTGIDIGSEEYLRGEEWVGEKGVRIGIISDKLVILNGRKKISESKKNILSLFQNSSKITLKIEFNYDESSEKYNITLSAITFSKKGKKKQRILRSNISSRHLANKKVFIFNEAPAKSIFYQNLIVDGGKIRFLNDKKINPIFSPHYIIQENKLYLNVVFLPIDQKINNIEVTFYNSRGVKLFDKTAYVEKSVPYHLFVVDNWKFRVPIDYTIKLNYQKLNDEKKIYERKGKIVNSFRKKMKILTIGENNFFYQKNHFSPNDKLKIKFINDIKKQRPNLIVYSPNQVDFRNDGKPPLSTSLRKIFFDYLYRLYFFSDYFQELNSNSSSINILGNKDFGQTFLWGSKFKRNQFSQKEGVFLPPKAISEIFNIRRGNLKFTKKKGTKKDLFARNPFSQEISFKKSKVSLAIINNSFYRYSPKYFIKKFNLNQQKYEVNLLIKNNKNFLFAPSQIQYLEKWKNNINKTEYKKILITSNPFQDFSSLRESDFFNQNNKKINNQVNYKYNAWPVEERSSLISEFENILHFSMDTEKSGIFQYKDIDNRKRMKLYLQSSISPNFYKNSFGQSDELVDGFGNSIEKSIFFTSKKDIKIQYSILKINKKEIEVERRQISENEILDKEYTIK